MNSVNLSYTQIEDVNGGVVVTTVVAVVVGISAVASLIVVAYQAGQIIGEAVQRTHEQNQQN